MSTPETGPEPAATPSPGREPDDDVALLAAWALDACDPDETRAVGVAVTAGAFDPAPGDTATPGPGLLVEAAGQLAGLVAAPPAPALRGRVLAAALAHRGGLRPIADSAARVHHDEAARARDLLAGLADDDWQRPVGPITSHHDAPVTHWTVADLAAHVAAVEVALADRLDPPADGATPPPVPDDPRRLLDAWAAASHRIDAAASALAAIGDGAAVAWPADEPMPVDGALLDRAFETWTHADDVRAAVGLPPSPPRPEALLTMSTFVASLLPHMLGEVPDAPGRGHLVIDLTGPGGATHEIVLGGDDPDDDAPATVLRLDVVDFCRAIGHRGLDDLHPVVTGDAGLAAATLAALPVLSRV